MLILLVIGADVLGVVLVLVGVVVDLGVFSEWFGAECGVFLLLRMPSTRLVFPLSEYWLDVFSFGLVGAGVIVSIVPSECTGGVRGGFGLGLLKSATSSDQHVFPGAIPYVA